MTISLFPSEHRLGLLTDLYELSMAAGYFAHGLAAERVTFELWIRRLPECRNYLIAAGLEQAVHYLEDFNFSQEEIDYLRRHPAFQHVPPAWFDVLATVLFDGDVWAVPEGTVVFAGEPLLRITGPLMSTQIFETYLITSITAQMLVASKAARIVQAAKGRPVFDFGARRGHGPQAGLLAARASYLAGCVGTSYTEAGRLLDIPTFGTQAHSWIMAWGDETLAFQKFGEIFPDSATLLVDTYDTLHGVRHALASGAPVQAVRLDSGDLAHLSRTARGMLDAAGRHDVKIVASGDLNEYKIARLLEAHAPIDLFGVGTELATSRDEPTLSTVYKLVEQETAKGVVGRVKLSADKKTHPYAKQVYRHSGGDGLFSGDVIAGATEQLPGEPLLVPVLRQGRLLHPLPTLIEIRERCRRQLEQLPGSLLRLDPADPYPVKISDYLDAETRRLGG
jgi:nicotinate phosphoribosyltransferase